AQKVQDQIRERVGRVDRGVRQAPFWVISFTTMPSVLIELGFLTNREEEDFLMGSKGQDYMASAIYRAFKEYKANLEKVDSTIEEVPTKPEVDAPDTTAPTTASDTDGPVFRIQIMASSKPVEIAPENFNGLENVELYRDNGSYKYLYGS